MPDPVERLRLFSNVENRQRIRDLSARILEDAAFRRRFLDDPRGALDEIGFQIDGNVELSARDRALLEVIDDDRVVNLFEAGQFSELDRYVRERYGALVPDAAEGEGNVNVDTDVLVVVLVVIAVVVSTEAVVVVEVPPPGGATR